MWIKMTPEENVEANTKRKRQELRFSILDFSVLCLFVAIVTAAMNGRREYNTLNNLRSWDEFLQCLPDHLLFAAAMSLLFAFSAFRWGLFGKKQDRGRMPPVQQRKDSRW